jgi:hypothetical protein
VLRGAQFRKVGLGIQPSITLAAPRRRRPRLALSLVPPGTTVSSPGTKSSRHPEVARALQRIGALVPFKSSR